jgi:hypothetical protein
MEVRFSPLWTALAGIVAAAGFFVGGYCAAMAAAAAPAEPPTAQVSFPDWFLPIWDAYDRNPSITPAFDFAALYSGDIRR